MKVFLISMCLLLFGACGDKVEEKVVQGEKTVQQEQVTEVKEKMDKNQELNTFLGAEPKTLDPSRSTDAYSTVILSKTNEGLLNGEMDENGVIEHVVPAGAESWSVSEDGLVWTFNLRKEAIWADGKPVTADQYQYGIVRTLDPKVGSNYAFLLYPIKGAKEFNAGTASEEDVLVKALDDYTLQITLSHPTPYFEELGYFKVMFPQRKDIVEKYGEAYGSEGDHILSNGPFILKEWVHNNKVILEKNPNYWDSENYKLTKISMFIVPDENSRMNLTITGQVDMGGGVSKPEWIDVMEKDGNFINLKRYDMGTNYVVFNTTSRYLKNEKVRKAFSLAMDREEINKVMFDGLFIPAYGFVSKGVKIGDKEYRDLVEEPLKKLIAENIDPKALLIEGLEELGEDADPAKMDITVLASSTTGWERKYSELLQQMLKNRLGVNIKADFVEWPVYQKRTDELDYEIGGMAWIGDYNDPNTFLDMWVTGAGIIPTGWTNEEFDQLIEKASLTSNQEERMKYFQEAEDILVYRDAVIAPTLYRVSNGYYRKYIKNYNPTNVAPYTLKNVYIDGRE